MICGKQFWRNGIRIFNKYQRFKNLKDELKKKLIKIIKKLINSDRL
ncbi:unnamed protein product [Paramecium sonneborni]|uniref:Uncharacterized protein n=1 Tax=Paramecium sonneborni TaxID=65129 RepID=A0A8S1Q4Y3_9CILI|nr:unnamed protein product [Paramecium sonneborni]